MLSALPLLWQLRDKAREAHEDVNKSNRLESGYVKIHTILPSRPKDHLAKVFAVSTTIL